MSKKKITIEVDAEMTVITLGLMRGFMPSIFQHMRSTMKEVSQSMSLNADFEDKAGEVIDEIYEKFMAETTTREGAANLMEILRITGRFPDNTIEN